MRGGSSSDLLRLGCLGCFNQLLSLVGSWMDGVFSLSFLFGGLAFVEREKKETENVSS